MPSERVRNSASYLALFLLPVAAVEVTGLLFSPSLSAAAPLEPGAEVPVLINAQKQQWTEKQLAAAAYLEAAQTQRFLDSPLFYQSNSVEIVEGAYRAIDRMQVDGIMTSGTQQFVLIDGVQYKLHDLIEDTAYRINEINSNERRITVKSIETGEKIDLYVKGP